VEPLLLWPAVSGPLTGRPTIDLAVGYRTDNLAIVAIVVLCFSYTINPSNLDVPYTT
jgi:hypothetical protein